MTNLDDWIAGWNGEDLFYLGVCTFLVLVLVLWACRSRRP